ncbi:MAG: ATP-binding cassette domain-containing protein, partial [Promethearchaeota archaeon]
MVVVELKNVSFSQKGVDILTDINLTIHDREYLTIVGPTGAGKTSLIGLLSGLYTPTSGQILFNGLDITHLPPYERHCGVMFESYALFPHLSVIDNISYARHMHESNHEETYAIGEAMLDLVRLNGREQALPHECSG